MEDVRCVPETRALPRFITTVPNLPAGPSACLRLPEAGLGGTDVDELPLAVPGGDHLAKGESPMKETSRA